MLHFWNWFIVSSDKQGPNLKGPCKRDSLNLWTLPEDKYNKLPECGVLRTNTRSKVQDVKSVVQLHQKHYKMSICSGDWLRNKQKGFKWSIFRLKACKVLTNQPHYILFSPLYSNNFAYLTVFCCSTEQIPKWTDSFD